MGRRILRYVRLKYAEAGFLSVFGLDEPFVGDVREALSKDIHTALAGDKEKVYGDFRTVFRREAKILDEAATK